MKNYSRKFLVKMPKNIPQIGNSDGNGKTVLSVGDLTLNIVGDVTLNIFQAEKNAAIAFADEPPSGLEIIAEITGNDFYSDGAISARGGKILTLEVERRWLVKIPPNIEDFQYMYIEQDYLAPESGFQGRIRRLDDKFIYTEKARTDSAAARIENEREITAEEYAGLKSHTILNTIKKRRYLIPHGGLTFEFDVFENTVESGIAIMEAELEDENAEIEFPDFIKIIREVTDDSYYTNRNFASMEKIKLLK